VASTPAGRTRCARTSGAEAARLHSEGQSLGKIAALFGCGRTVVLCSIHGDAV
jgi:hypothetical protein